MADGTIPRPYVRDIDFTDRCTFPDGAPAHFFAVKHGNLVTIYYQGPNKTHAVGDVLVRVPSEFALSNGSTSYSSQVHAPFVANTVGYGSVVIQGSSININGVSSISGNSRIYFELTYPVF